MRVTGKRTLWKGRFINAVEISYEDKNGRPCLWEAIDRVNSDGVIIIVPITTDSEVVLIRQYRPVLDRYIIELPAGLVEKGEDRVKAAWRELIEETGHVSEDIKPIFEGVMSTGINSEIWHAMLARDSRSASPDLVGMYPPDDNEDIQVIKVPLNGFFDALDAMAVDGQYVDVRIYGLVELARRKMEAPGA